MSDGIVLDETTAPLVPVGSVIQTPGGLAGRTGESPPFSGAILTHLAGRPVADVVADVDQAKAHDRMLRHWRAVILNTPGNIGNRRSIVGEMSRVADFLDAIADRMLAPVLVQAWHDQHPRGGDE